MSLCQSECYLGVLHYKVKACSLLFLSSLPVFKQDTFFTHLGAWCLTVGHLSTGLVTMTDTRHNNGYDTEGEYLTKSFLWSNATTGKGDNSLNYQDKNKQWVVSLWLILEIFCWVSGGIGFCPVWWWIASLGFYMVFFFNDGDGEGRGGEGASGRRSSARPRGSLGTD